MFDLATILERAPLGEVGLLELAAGSARALVETLGSESCEIWLWRKDADGEPRLVRAGSFGPPIPEADSHESVQELGDRAFGGTETSAIGDEVRAAHSIQLPLGLHGHALIALGEAPLTDPMLAWLRHTAEDLAEGIARRLPHGELVEMNRWLLKRNSLDRKIARSFAEVRTLEELGRTIDAVAGELFVVEYSGIYFLDPDSGELRLVHARGLTEAERCAAERTAEARHPGFVMRTGRVVDVPDTAKHASEHAPDHASDHAPNHAPNHAPDHASYVGEEPPSHGKHILSRMYLPVRVDGLVVGTVGFASTRRGSFSSRHRQVLSFLGDFAGLTYARIVSAHESERRGALVLALHSATERLLSALDWRSAATSVLALLGSALDAGTLALLELQPSSEEAGNPQAIEFTWQPVFGRPWTHGARLIDLTAEEREQLLERESVEISFADAKDAALLKPVIIDGALWGVLAYEPLPSRHRTLDAGERAALRALATAFGLAFSRERLDETLRQRQKMEAVGMLADGLAKDFNNLLWPILLYTEMLERSVQLDARMQQVLKDIRTAARGASDLVQQVLAISRRRDRLIELVSVSESLNASIGLLRRSAPTAVELQVSIEPDLGEVLGDPDSIQQMMTNLGARAFEALRGRVGRVRIEASAIMRMNRRFVRIVVQDDGRGFDPGTRARLFEPMFARQSGGETRTVELGLSVVHRIVTELDGIITVQSEPTRGTRFEILLPAALGAASTGARVSAGGTMDASMPVRALASEAPPAAELGLTDARPGEVVLAVDDDAPVLEVVRQMLESAGYTVIACANPRDAMGVVEDLSKSIALLVTDLTMPGMTGIELAADARRLRPGLRVVCCTGFGDERSERRALAAGMSAFVRKPIDLESFLKTVRGAIDA